MPTSEPISPGEEDLNTALTSLKKAHPALGITKLHTLLLSENPSWTVSEKRLRRILKNHNHRSDADDHHQADELESATPGGPSSGSGHAAAAPHAYPSSTLVEGLDVFRWTPTIEVKYFDKQKGKGLVAKEPISEGQVVWKEDPFIIAPEW
jgi:hypothetical protein